MKPSLNHSRHKIGTQIKVVGATFSALPMSRTDVVGGPVRACRTLSGGARPQIAGSYLPTDAPKLAQASKMIVLTHLSDKRSQAHGGCLAPQSFLHRAVDRIRLAVSRPSTSA